MSDWLAESLKKTLPYLQSLNPRTRKALDYDAAFQEAVRRGDAGPER